MSAATDETILCPLCDYDLRGLVEPRCPECGYRFDWDELRDPTRRLHRYLFEHHPERNLRSLRQTFIASLRPRRFWAQLHPTQSPRLRRLIVYWVIITSVILVPFLLQLGYLTYLQHAYSKLYRSRAPTWIMPEYKAAVTQQYGTFERYLDVQAPLLPSWRVPWLAMGRSAFALIALWIISWPWMTLAALMIFRASMRKAQVKMVHVLRCVIYSADAIALAALAVIGWIVFMMRAPQILSYRYGDSEFAKTVLLVMFLILSYRLWIAYRKYLRFDHALATVVSSQVIVALAVWKFGLDMDMLHW